jgi:non-heme chloroperoxidase
MIRHQFKTQDDVTLNAVETGNPLGQAILFVHGLSQSWRSWRAQFADPQLRERFRLLALDLRGHGESQGAFGAIDQEGNPLASLSEAQYHDGNVETTSRSWAYDLDATIEALHLDHPILIGWSAGAWAVQSYFLANRGLGAIGKAILYASTPVLLPPGTENGGSHLSVRPETIDALLRTYPVNPTFDPPSPNEDRTVAIGLMDFIHLCFADETGRAVSFASIQETMAFNLLTPPQVRLLLGTRWFDSRPLLAGLSDADRQRLMALTPQGDRIFYADVSNAYWAASRIRNVRVQREGHCCHLRSADDFNQQVAAFASSK